MGTIIPRKRKDGTTGYTAQIEKNKGGEIVWSEAQTFDRRKAAEAWLARREVELAQPGALERKDDPPLAAVIDRYIAESKKRIGRTKAQVLRTIKGSDLAELRCSKIGSADLIAFAQSLPVQPSTVQNYLSHLGAVFAVARPAWGYPLDRQAIRDAFVVAKKLGVTGKGRSRDRRPTLAELDKLMEHFGTVKARRPLTAPMQKIIVFALYSARRQEEITRITWDDYDKTRVMVRDMKHPGDKDGNDTWCDLPAEAAAIIDTMPKTYEQDGLGDQAIASLHYFLGGCDWYITEKDAEAPDSLGQHQAFGWADLGGGGELGYISLVELLANGAELDFHFRPCTLAALKAAGKITP